MSNEIQFLLYNMPDADGKVQVVIKNETLWCTQKAMAELFGIDKSGISRHIANIFKEEELQQDTTVAKIATVVNRGIRGEVEDLVDFYNLDMILSIGYRVKSKRGIQFRQWANKVLKDYLLKGYSINQRLNEIEQKMDNKFFQIEKTIAEHDKKIDFFVRTSLPPVEGIFFDGQIFDAYKFATDLIKSAKHSLILIDNYVDDTVLTLLGKRNDNVTATIYTKSISNQLRLDVQRYNSQYPRIEIKVFSDAHDRFLIIDDVELYHIGASLKDLGKKWFAFSQIKNQTALIMKALDSASSKQTT